MELLLELEELLAGEGSPPPPRLAVTSLGCKIKERKKIIIVKEKKSTEIMKKNTKKIVLGKTQKSHCERKKIIDKINNNKNCHKTQKLKL